MSILQLVQVLMVNLDMQTEEGKQKGETALSVFESYNIQI
jgi:hypothetical protein